MRRELNRYVNIISGEELNVIQMYNFVNEEAKRQVAECSGELWCNLTLDEQQECILEQWQHQLDSDWERV